MQFTQIIIALALLAGGGIALILTGVNYLQGKEKKFSMILDTVLGAVFLIAIFFQTFIFNRSYTLFVIACIAISIALFFCAYRALKSMKK